MEGGLKKGGLIEMRDDGGLFGGKELSIEGRLVGVEIEQSIYLIRIFGQ